MATIVVGTNSYVTAAECTTYAADRYGYGAWATETNKEEALISATQQLDVLCDWYGTKSDTDQTLEFPRNSVDADPVPQAVKDAQCEIAFAIVTTGAVVTVADDALTELKAGSVTMKFKATSPNNPLINDLVTKLMTPYGRCGGGGSIPLVRD